jgi:hypothetical protein
MDTEVYRDILIDLLFFLECSGAEVVDEDTAVATLEMTASALQRLSPLERERFINRASTRASSETGTRRRFLERLPVVLRLNDDFHDTDDQ